MLDENNNTSFFNRLVNNITASSKEITIDKLREYDENIIRHTKTMGRDINWKYFQYLSLLFVEMYLDKFFESKEELLNNLNEFPARINRINN
jgi:hypothetical protein